jgi:hypothetical protein
MEARLSPVIREGKWN